MCRTGSTPSTWPCPAWPPCPRRSGRRRVRRDWNRFSAGVQGLLARYQAAGLNFARSAYLVGIRAAVSPGSKQATMTLETEIPGLDIRYTTNGTDPGPSSKRYKKPIVLRKTTEIRAAAFDGTERLSPAVVTERFVVHAASGRTPVLTAPFSPDRAGGGDTALTDGLLGSRNSEDGRWQGFEGVDLDAVDRSRRASVRAHDRREVPAEHQLMDLPAGVGRIRRLFRRPDLRDRGRGQERRLASPGRSGHQGIRGRASRRARPDTSGSGPRPSAPSPTGITGRAASPGSSPTRSSSNRRSPGRAVSRARSSPAGEERSTGPRR